MTPCSKQGSPKGSPKAGSQRTGCAEAIIKTRRHTSSMYNTLLHVITYHTSNYIVIVSHHLTEPKLNFLADFVDKIN